MVLSRGLLDSADDKTAALPQQMMQGGCEVGGGEQRGSCTVLYGFC